MRWLILASALMVSACNSADSGDSDSESAAADQAASDRTGTAGQLVDTSGVEGVTPLADRVATLGLLNKRNNESQDIELSPGDTLELGPVIVTLQSCERTAPWEMPQETGAFVQVDVLERAQSTHTRVFSGWLFKNSPSLNVVEHPIYDVWVKDCAMAFPGDE